MSRRHAAEKREIQPDAKFNDVVLTKFINSLMYAGKRSVAEHIVYGAFDIVQKKGGQDPVRIFHDALQNVAPHLEVLVSAVGLGPLIAGMAACAKQMKPSIRVVGVDRLEPRNGYPFAADVEHTWRRHRQGSCTGCRSG